jgi:hypothetical protein
MLSLCDLVTLAGTTGGTYDGKFAVLTVPLTTTFTISSALTTGQAGTGGTVAVPPQTYIAARDNATIGLAIAPFSSSGNETARFYHSNGSTYSGFDNASRLFVRTSGINHGTPAFAVNTASDTAIGAVIRGASATQSADLQQWQNSAGTVLSGVAASGKLFTGSTFGLTPSGSTITAQVSVTASALDVAGIVVKGAVSQSANLLELQSSAGAVIYGFDASGNITRGGITNMIISTSRNIQFASGTGSFGGGGGVLGIANAGTVPSTNPTGGGVLYVDAGALSYIGTTGSASVIINSNGTSGNAPISITSTTSVSYTLSVTDSGKNVEMNSASPNTVTIPTNATAPFPVGAQVTIIQTNTGATSVSATSGVTFNFYSPTSATGTAVIKGQWAGVTLVKRATDTWAAIGNIT